MAAVPGSSVGAVAGRALLGCGVAEHQRRRQVPLRSSWWDNAAVRHRTLHGLRRRVPPGATKGGECDAQATRATARARVPDRRACSHATRYRYPSRPERFWQLVCEGARRPHHAASTPVRVPRLASVRDTMLRSERPDPLICAVPDTLRERTEPARLNLQHPFSAKVAEPYDAPMHSRFGWSAPASQLDPAAPRVVSYPSR